MKWKAFAAEYLKFSRKERIAVIILSTVIVVILFAPAWFQSREPTLLTPDAATTAAFARLDSVTTVEANSRRGNQHPVPAAPDHQSSPPALFAFDPNVLDSAGWARLGLPARSIGSILRYRSKGGHFRKPEDVGKIYNLPAADFERIRPFIRLGTEPGNRREYPKRDSLLSNVTNVSYKKRTYTRVEINTADTSTWAALPGIGEKLAARIVKFREQLGGFYDIEQVREVFGLKDSVFQVIREYLVINNGEVKKIRINTATIDEWKKHPYVRYALGKRIVAYREQHGQFATLDELKKVAGLDSIFVRLKSYLSL